MFKKLLGKYYWPYTIVSMALLVAYFAFFVVEDDNTVCKKMFLRDKKVSYRGIVKDKFIDEHQHNYKTIILASNRETDTLIFGWDRSGLYNFLSVDDSVYKAADSSLVLIFRQGEIHEFILNYGCDWSK